MSTGMNKSWPPTLISNRYRLLESLGEGGFGVVYRAEDLKYNPPRLVALKLLHLNLINDLQICADLRREASILASFNHPNIVRVLDYEVSPNLAYIVTEIAAGGSLERKLNPNPSSEPVSLPLQQVANYLEQISKGLDEIHSKGQIHRDIKPANILLDEADNLLLADFGVAISLNNAASSRLVTSVVAWGTAEYAAPEVWDDKVGKASDIYALGVLTYQMLTGRPPYQGSVPAIMKQHLVGEIPSLSKYLPYYNNAAALDRVIARAMATSPQDRYKKAQDFSQAFKMAVEVKNQPVQTLLNSFLNAIAVPPPPTNNQGFGATNVKVDPNSPQEIARQHMAQQLEYLSGLFNKAEKWGEWDNAIEISKLILNLDKNNKTIIDHTSQIYRQRALSFLRSQKYRKAFGDLMAAIKLDPDTHTKGIKRFLVVSYDFISAFNAVLKAIQPTRTNFAFANGQSKTTADFTRAIEREPNRSEHYFERGKYFCSHKDFNRAITDFTRAIELEPDKFLKTWYYRERGAAFEQIGNRRAARKDFLEADRFLKVASNF